MLYSLLTPSLAASTTITTSLQPTKAPRGQIHLPTPSPTPKTSHGSQIAAAKSFIQLIAHHHHPVRFTYLHPAQLQIPPAATRKVDCCVLLCSGHVPENAIFTHWDIMYIRALRGKPSLWRACLCSASAPGVPLGHPGLSAECDGDF